MRVTGLPPSLPALLLALMATALLFAFLTAAPARAGVCEQAIAAAAQRHGVDRNLMLAIGRVESGLTPWVLNAEGVGQRFASKRAAVSRVAELQASGVSSIDVGCMQVNLRWHPEAFAGLEQAFDPFANADYAARYLRRLRAELGSWTRAAVRYHSASPERQEIYGCAIQAEFDRLRAVTSRPCVYRPGGQSASRQISRPTHHGVPAGTTVVLRPAGAGAEPAPVAAPADERADAAAEADSPVATARQGQGPEIIRLDGGSGNRIAMLRGTGTRPAGGGANANANAERTPARATATAETALVPHEPRARVIRMPGASEPAAVSVITGGPAAIPGFALD